MDDFDCYFEKRKSSQTVSSKGTRFYRSPDQRKFELSEVESYNAFKADVFALGMTAFVSASLDPPSDDTMLWPLRDFEEEVRSKVQSLSYSAGMRNLLLQLLSETEESRPVIRDVLQFAYNQLCKLYKEANLATRALGDYAKAQKTLQELSGLISPDLHNLQLPAEFSDEECLPPLLRGVYMEPQLILTILCGSKHVRVSSQYVDEVPCMISLEARGQDSSVRTYNIDLMCVIDLSGSVDADIMQMVKSSFARLIDKLENPDFPVNQAPNSSEKHREIAAISLPLADEITPGYEGKEIGCQRCGKEVCRYRFHNCAIKEGRCCGWCFMRLIICSPYAEYCPFCLAPWRIVLCLGKLHERLPFLCEGCNKPSDVMDIFHRSRCGKHIICAKCACRKLRETNGLNACPLCVIPNEPFQQVRCLRCNEESSFFVHADPTDHSLCWNCALQLPPTAAKCECGSFLTDRFREALLMETGEGCYFCMRYRPLIKSRCGCSILMCAECSFASIKCPLCRNNRDLSVDWVMKQKMNCVECLSTSVAFSLTCGHYCHRGCLERTGGCSLCWQPQI